MALRILAESIARNRWPRGAHVAYVTTDAVIDLAWTRRMHAHKPDDFFIAPDAVADELNRPFGERW